MALRHAVLAALLEGEASGYQLAKRFDVSVANFWSATSQQLYRELDRLEAEGLVRARLVRQQRRPDKRVFTLTDAGRDVVAAIDGVEDPAPSAFEALDVADLRALRDLLAKLRAH